MQPVKKSTDCALMYMTGVVLCTSLLLYKVTAAMGVDDTCLMTLVVPKEKIKHTCDVQERFQKKLDYLEEQFAYQAKLIKDLEVLLIKKKQPKDSMLQVDKPAQVIPDHQIFLPPSMPDLSDDYPDFDDYYPPDVSSRADHQAPNTPGAGRPTSQSQNRKGLNLLALDLLKPYIDRELAKLKVNISRSIGNTLHPFAAGFEEVKKFTLRNRSRDMNTVSPGAQTSMNTIALSHMFVQVSNVHDKLLHMNTQHIILQKKISGLDARVMSLHQTANQRTLDLRSRILELEHENRLLKVNQTCQSELKEIRLDIAKQISNAKDHMRLNCKSRRRTKVRARIAQDDYYYDDDNVDAENVIENDTLKPLTEMPAFQELEKNVSALQTLISQQFQRQEEANVKAQAAWNVTQMRLQEEKLERKQADEHVNASTQLMVQQVQRDIVNFDDELKLVRDTAEEIQANMKAQQKMTDQQLTNLRQLLSDLQEDTITNFSRQSDQIKNTTWTLGMSIHKLQKADEEHALELKSAIGKSTQKLTENRLSILEWRDRVWEHNSSISHLSKDLRSLSEEVHVSVLSLNESVRTLGVQFQLNNETWLPYSFTHTQGHTKCYGEKYVKKTNYPSGSIVGVVLCSPDMYKIFLSDSLTDTFLDVADSDGFGHDHCEFVGGKLERTTQLGNTPVFYKKHMGYRRHSWGEQPKRTYLGLTNPSPEWYRCGISISG